MRGSRAYLYLARHARAARTQQRTSESRRPPGPAATGGRHRAGDLSHRAVRLCRRGAAVRHAGVAGSALVRVDRRIHFGAGRRHGAGGRTLRRPHAADGARCRGTTLGDRGKGLLPPPGAGTGGGRAHLPELAVAATRRAARRTGARRCGRPAAPCAGRSGPQSFRCRHCHRCRRRSCGCRAAVPGPGRPPVAKRRPADRG